MLMGSSRHLTKKWPWKTRSSLTGCWPSRLKASMADGTHVSTDIVAAPPGERSREALEQLSRSRREPDWLLEVRRRAFDAFARLPVPDQRTEGWRRTSLRGLDLRAFDPSTGAPRVSVS